VVVVELEEVVGIVVLVVVKNEVVDDDKFDEVVVEDV
jgi:hypothetical protein